jgi:hypothetical protein
VDLSRTAVADAGLAMLKGATNLDAIELDRTAVTDEGLVWLATMPNLLGVSLNGTAVTDLGLEVMRQRGPQLRELSVRGTQVSQGAADALLASGTSRVEIGPIPPDDDPD